MIKNSERMQIWKETVVVYFKVPSLHSSAEPEKTKENLCYDSR